MRSTLFSVGDTGSLFLYYSTSGPSEADIDVGAIMDIATSQPGVIRFTDAEVFDFGGRRWSMNATICPAASGQSGTVFDDFINEWGAFTLNNIGIRATNKLLDPGYDADADAFLFGRVDYEVIGQGCVQIHTGRGQLGIANVRNAPFIPSSENNLIDVTFGSAQVSSIGPFDLGDVNLDGAVDFLDIGPFVDLIQSGDFSTEGDTNCDGVVSFLDISSFVDLLIGTTGFEVIDPSEENTEPQFGMMGDATNDGFIDLLDVTCFRFIGRDCGFFLTSDIDENGVVDFADICPFIDIVLEQN